ncbi:hypothetical protein [Paenibacillus polymyxa]|uniref:hypothetical protein n=1 Tax=Paenibacillus polymyxa TaxID=1406 RepID=UPI0039BC7019
MTEYELVVPKMEEYNKFIVTVVADSNDGDYITTINTYTKPYFEEAIVRDLIDLINNYSGHHELEKYDGEFEDLPFNPHDDYGRCHTLISVNIRFIDNKGFTWNVKL